MSKESDDTRSRSSKGGVVVKKRTRLAPETRRRQILEAALVEFSQHGFGGASIAKIAERAGMSKANFYVHFTSKDEIFETLIATVLDPGLGNWQLPDGVRDVKEVVDHFIEQHYDRGLGEQTVAVLRLMIAEGHRVPELMDKWYRQTLLPARAQQDALTRAHIGKGLVTPDVLTGNQALMMSPVLQAAVFKMVFEPAVAEQEVAAIRDAHRDMLLRLLSSQR